MCTGAQSVHRGSAAYAAPKLDWSVPPLHSAPAHMYPPHPTPELNIKGLPDTHISLFPLYCSSTGLEVCLDLQRALKRLRDGDRDNLDEGN